jgi:hypothetical protein
MKTIGLVLLVVVLALFVGNPLFWFTDVLAAVAWGVFGLVVGLAGGLFGLAVGLIGGGFGIVAGVVGAIFGIGVALVTLAIPLFICAVVAICVVKVIALA